MTREELLKNAKPILFNTEMVKAILENRKTVTRRVIKVDSKLKNVYHFKDRKSIAFGSDFIGNVILDYKEVKFPYQVGDILYVRETWGDYLYDKEHEINKVYYRADYENGVKTYIHTQKDDCGENIVCDLPKWNPSIHMPKEAARIFLKVTDLEVKRLNDISTSECQCEGLVLNRELYRKNMHDANIEIKSRFANLWNTTINKKDLDSYGWEANPYVWVIEFEKVEVKK